MSAPTYGTTTDIEANELAHIPTKPHYRTGLEVLVCALVLAAGVATTATSKAASLHVTDAAASLHALTGSNNRDAKGSSNFWSRLDTTSSADLSGVTCDNYASYESRSDLFVMSYKGKDAGKDRAVTIDPPTTANGVLVICDGEASCSGNARHTMRSGAVPVAILCCGEDACSGNYRFDTSPNTARGVDASRGRADNIRVGVARHSPLGSVSLSRRLLRPGTAGAAAKTRARVRRRFGASDPATR